MAKKRQQHRHRKKYHKEPKYPPGSGLPKTEHSPKPQDRDHTGKRIRSRGKFPTIGDRIKRRLETAKEKRAR